MENTWILISFLLLAKILSVLPIFTWSDISTKFSNHTRLWLMGLLIPESKFQVSLSISLLCGEQNHWQKCCYFRWLCYFFCSHVPNTLPFRHLICPWIYYHFHLISCSSRNYFTCYLGWYTISNNFNEKVAKIISEMPLQLPVIYFLSSISNPSEFLRHLVVNIFQFFDYKLYILHLFQNVLVHHEIPKIK